MVKEAIQKAYVEVDNSRKEDRIKGSNRITLVDQRQVDAKGRQHGQQLWNPQLCTIGNSSANPIVVLASMDSQC